MRATPLAVWCMNKSTEAIMEAVEIDYRFTHDNVNVFHSIVTYILAIKIAIKNELKTS
jgi:ADP-ribosylglycohydrolase